MYIFVVKCNRKSETCYLYEFFFQFFRGLNLVYIFGFRSKVYKNGLVSHWEPLFFLISIYYPLSVFRGISTQHYGLSGTRSFLLGRLNNCFLAGPSGLLLPKSIRA